MISGSVLVTGATGFLGHALVARLEDCCDEVTALGTKDADLRDPRSLDPLPRGRYDHVLHLAAWTQAGDFCLHHPGEQWLVNQQINTTVLTWWREAQPQAKLTSMGTSCCYSVGLPLVEENYLTGIPIAELYVYAMTKRMLLVGQRSLARQFGMRHLTLVPSTLYGPGYRTHGRQLHFIFDLIEKIVRGKTHGDPVVLWGDGSQRRELVYIDDFVDALVHLVGSVDDELVNVGAGEEHEIREFASIICEIVGFDPGRIRYDPAAYVGATSKLLDIRKLEHLMPGFRRTPLTEGLVRTIRWMEAQRREQARP
jgi:GDP-L-fucose synthase